LRGFIGSNPTRLGTGCLSEGRRRRAGGEFIGCFGTLLIFKRAYRFVNIF